MLKQVNVKLQNRYQEEMRSDKKKTEPGLTFLIQILQIQNWKHLILKTNQLCNFLKPYLHALSEINVELNQYSLQ